MAASPRPNGDEDHTVPISQHDPFVHDDTATEQHKSRRGDPLRLRSIRHFRHATTKRGAALESFSPLWFAISLSSGGLATLLNAPFAYPARWLATCSSILYVVDIATFAVFAALTLARWAMYPRVAARRAWSDPDELSAYAIAPITLMTIAALTASQVSEAAWGGHAFALVAYVLWWVGVVWVFATTVVVLAVHVYTGNQSDRTMSPVIFMAPVGLATAGTEAGFITIYGASVSARLAVPQLVVGYFAVGIALFTALVLYTLFVHRLLSAGWVPAAKRAGLFILIGPCGQLSTAFQILGESANQYMRFAQYKPSAVHPPSSGTFWTAQTGQGVDGSGILLALLLIGWDYLWLCLASIGLLDAFINHRKQLSYSLTWWSVVFPSVTFTTAWLELSRAMDSPTFRGLASAMTVIIAIVYFLNLGFTIWGIADGSLVFGPTQLEIEESMEQKAQGKEV